MKHVVRKAYWNYEKEEQWINEMCAKGMHLVNYNWTKYTFEEGERGEYIYRIEMLENLPTHAESVAYIKFLEENGVEHVSSYMRWVYLRKKAADGPFDVYTDRDSKLRHFKRINTFWVTLGFMELAIGLGNLGLVASLVASGEAVSLNGANFVGGTLCTVLGIFFLLMSQSIRKKIRRLKADAQVHE